VLPAVVVVVVVVVVAAAPASEFLEGEEICEEN